MTKPACIAAWIAAGAASMLMLGAVNATAGEYPDHPILLLVPGAAGGGMDAVARLVADTIGKSLKQTIVVENKPGAAGNIAVNQLAKSRPDGYTIVLGQTSQLAINPSLYRNLPYDPPATHRINRSPMSSRRRRSRRTAWTSRRRASAPSRISPPNCSRGAPASSSATFRREARTPL